MYTHTGPAHIVPTSELREGDIVKAHGTYFVLGQRNLSQYHTDSPTPVYWFRTHAVAVNNFPGPSHWLNDWTIQGNDFASWQIVNR